MKAKITRDFLIKLVLKFAFENLEKLCLQNLIPTFFDGTFQEFFVGLTVAGNNVTCPLLWEKI